MPSGSVTIAIRRPGRWFVGASSTRPCAATAAAASSSTSSGPTASAAYRHPPARNHGSAAAIGSTAALGKKILMWASPRANRQTAPTSNA